LDDGSARQTVEAIGGFSSSASRKRRDRSGWTPTPRHGIRTLGIPDCAVTDAETKRKAIENAYEPLTPGALPDWTLDSSLIGWLDSLGR
jgi:hypothetical protein